LPNVNVKSFYICSQLGNNFKLFLNFPNDMLTKFCDSGFQSWPHLYFNDRWPNCVLACER